MAHVDDGTLNALLDGELEAARAAEVRAHLASCAECSARFDEAKRFLAEASGLLDALVPPPAESRAPAAAAQPGVPAAPAERRIAKTAREVAIDIDGSTTKSPAIAPNFPRAGDPAPPPFASPRDRWGQPILTERPARRFRVRLDWPTLAWAASVMLALGVGYLANEVRQGRRAQAASERSLADATPTVPSAAPAAGAPARQPAAPGVAQRTRSGAREKEVRSVAANAPSGKSAAEVLAAAPTAPAARPLAAGRELAAAVPASPGVETAEARAQRPGAAPAPSAAEQRLADAAHRAEVAVQAPAAAPRAATAVAPRPAPVAGAPATGGVPARAAGTFQAIDFDQAAARLSGTARWIEGLSLESVKIGPGSLVSGADPARDVVRVVYADAQGRHIQLDQQRLASRRAAPAGLGLAWGDTLATAGPAGGPRIRWLDRAGLWLSLTGNVPADSLRALLARVR